MAPVARLHGLSDVLGPNFPGSIDEALPTSSGNEFQRLLSICQVRNFHPSSSYSYCSGRSTSASTRKDAGPSALSVSFALTLTMTPFALASIPSSSIQRELRPCSPRGATDPSL